MAIPVKYNVRNLLVRKMATFVTASGISLVVTVMILLLSLVTGLNRMMVVTGSEDNLVVTSKGATTQVASFVQRDKVQALRYLPGIAQTPEGEPLVSPELLTQPLCRSKSGKEEIILARGVTPMGFIVHKNVRFIAGRAPQPSLGEAAVGIAASHRYEGAGLGQTLQFGLRNWTVVGIFTADGSLFESEVWVDVDDLFKAVNHGNYSSVCLAIAPGTDRDVLIRRLADDPRISLQGRSEVEFYSEQAEDTNNLYFLTLILAVIMGTGAVFGAMNTMFAAVTYRTAEIGTLRALGFSYRDVLTSFIGESVYLSLIGYIGGVVLGAGAITLVNFVMYGVGLQIRGFTTAVVILYVSPLILLQALVLAVLMGILGGLFPARRAAKLRVTDALRRA